MPNYLVTFAVRVNDQDNERDAIYRADEGHGLSGHWEAVEITEPNVLDVIGKTEVGEGGRKFAVAVSEDVRVNVYTQPADEDEDEDEDEGFYSEPYLVVDIEGEVGHTKVTINDVTVHRGTEDP